MYNYQPPTGFKYGKNADKIKKSLRDKTQGYCPCRLERIEENICPCEEFQRTGKCICGLFEKV